MTTHEFLSTVAEELKDIINKDLIGDITTLEVIPVWYSKTIQNHKGLFIIKNNNNGYLFPKYFECTYNGDAKALYIDHYQKIAKTTKTYL